MSLSLESFRIRYPEFAKVADDRVTLAISDALPNTNYGVFGDDAEYAHAALAAHILASGPTGREARLNRGQGPTTYSLERQRLETMNCAIRGIL